MAEIIKGAGGGIAALSKSGPVPQIELRPPGELRPNPNNARKHSKKQIKQIATSIEAAGFVGVVIVDENDMVVAGGGRLKASERLGMTLVPTLKVVGLSEVQKRAFVLADNKIAENAGWDREMLVKELGDLATLFKPLNKARTKATGLRLNLHGEVEENC
jgi:ParB-like chromosome segregation protein Spo0J